MGPAKNQSFVRFEGSQGGKNKNLISFQIKPLAHEVIKNFTDLEYFWENKMCGNHSWLTDLCVTGGLEFTQLNFTYLTKYTLSCNRGFAAVQYEQEILSRVCSLSFPSLFIIKCYYFLGPLCDTLKSILIYSWVK